LWYQEFGEFYLFLANLVESKPGKKIQNFPNCFEIKGKKEIVGGKNQSQSQAGIFLRILWCSQGGDHPEINLANYGYIPDMKVEKNQDPSIFLATYWNLL